MSRSSQNPDDPAAALEIPAAVLEKFDDANGLFAIGELEEAINGYKACVTEAPQFFDAWHALAMALMKTGRFQEAVEAGLQAASLRPNDQLVWSSLSLFYVRLGEIKKAEEAAAKARILSWGGKIVKTAPSQNPAAPPPQS